jgi:hypothetical protein
LITGPLGSHYILILKANQPLALQAAQVLLQWRFFKDSVRLAA